MTVDPVVVHDDSTVSPLLAFLGGEYPSGDHRLAAHSRIVASCMQARGWEYPPIDPTAYGESEPTTFAALLEFRAEHGFGLALDTSALADIEAYKDSVDAIFVAFEALDEDDRDRYLNDLDGGTAGVGDPGPGSCEAEAAAATWSPIADTRVTGMANEVLDTIMTRDVLAAATEAWARCMAERGHTYATRAQPVLQLLSLQEYAPAEEFRELEIGVAVADLECARDTILPIQIAAEREAVKRVVEAFPEYARFAD